jgi:ABC-2 type transport system ATP-binding protein
VARRGALGRLAVDVRDDGAPELAGEPECDRADVGVPLSGTPGTLEGVPRHGGVRRVGGREEAIGKHGPKLRPHGPLANGGLPAVVAVVRRTRFAAAHRSHSDVRRRCSRHDLATACLDDVAMTAPVIETDRLTKRYGAARGIEDVSLSVQRGEVFGFLGPNGAGKTTTIRTLLDLLHPTSGSARLFGLDSRRDSVAIRARLGNLPGELAWDPRRTGHEVVALLAALRGMDGLGRAGELEERFHADLDRPIGHLSRGNRQKIGIIQALFHAPELLILDEPTGGLDPLMQEELHQLVGEERDRGATVFLSSHDLEEVQRLCDRVAIIRDGRLVAIEHVADLTAKRLRHATVEFTEPVDASDLRRLAGVRDVEVSGRRVRFGVEASALDGVVKALARHEIVDLELAHPSLEEVFLALYSGEEQPR